MQNANRGLFVKKNYYEFLYFVAAESRTKCGPRASAAGSSACEAGSAAWF